MKKACTVLVLTCLIICSGCNKNDHGGYGEIDDYNWNMLTNESEYVRFESQEEFLKEVDYYINTISKYLSKPNWLEQYNSTDGDKIKFKYTSGVSHVEGGYYHKDNPKLVVYYNNLFMLDYAPIAHEITHLIVPFYSSLSLREGLACLMQDTYGNNYSVFNFGAPIHSLAKQYTKNDYEEVIKSIGEEGIPKINIKKNDRFSFYILSYSFTNYLIDEYGVKKFMKIYESDELETSYIKVYNKNLNQLKEDWKEFLKTQDDYEYTCEELIEENIVKKFKK